MTKQNFGNMLKKAVGVEGSFKEAILPMLGYNAASILFGGGGYIISLYFLSFLTGVEGLSTSQAGIVVGLAHIWDAVTDPAMGIIADRTRSKYGKHRRYILWGVLPIAISYFLLWNSMGISALGNSTYTMIYYCCAYMLFNTAYTLVAVPQVAMLPEIAPEYFMRTQYKSIEYIMNSVGMVSSFVLVSVSIGFSNTKDFTPELRPKFVLLGVILCIWFSLPLVITFFGTKEKPSLNMPVPPLNLREMLNEYKLVFKNRAFRRYFAISTCYSVSRGFYSNSNQYFIRHIAKRWSYYNLFNTVSGVAEASGFPLNFALTKKYGKQKCGKLLAPLMLAGILINLFVTKSTPVAFIFIAICLYYFGYSGVGFVGTNIQPDVTDVDEMITGRRREGVISTFNSLIKKTISGLMASFTGIILGAFGFVTTENAVQSALGTFGLRLTFSIIPALFVIITDIFIYKYKMTKDDHAMIKAAIAQKHETGSATLTAEQIAKCEEIAGVAFHDMWLGQVSSKAVETVE